MASNRVTKTRKDNRGRNLKKGEYQDKDGRYVYHYTNVDGKPAKMYSWRLRETDKMPKDKRPCKSLERLEAEIQTELTAGINTKKAKKYTIKTLFYERMENDKAKLKPTTYSRYEHSFLNYIQPNIGDRLVSEITKKEIRAFYENLISEGMNFPNLGALDCVLRPCLQLAVEKNLIATNPIDGVYSDMCKEYNYEPNKREGLDEDEQAALINFVKRERVYTRWLPIITTFLGTGLRVGELTGLQWDDIDFARETITVRHNHVYWYGNKSGMVSAITTPKTKGSERVIDMLPDVKQVLLEEKARQKKEGGCTSVLYDAEGNMYSDFVFINRNRHVIINSALDSALKNITNRYNLQAEKTGAIKLPRLSCHILRHTFCTRLCENTTNIKAVQVIMGHTNITTTMDTYTRLTAKKRREAMTAFGENVVIS